MKQASFRALLFIFALTLFLPIMAQEQSVTLSVKNAPLSEVLTAIERQTSYHFSYRDVTLDPTADITLSVRRATVREVLDKALAGKNLSYTIISEKSIVLTNKVKRSGSSTASGNRKVSGVVRSADGEPLLGATVMVKGTGKGVATDIDGHFEIDAPARATLTISYVGCETSEVSVNGKDHIKVTLQDDATLLAEVVAVGYGTQRREELSSSVASIKEAQFAQVSTPDAAALIRGKVAGLTVVQADGDPLSLSQIQLRGITTLKSGIEPLVLIDGIPGDMNTVSPNDIEQIDVLKDGSAAAIYGTRGTNGVILITTKHAKGEIEPSISVKSYVAVQQIVKKLDMMNADQYRALANKGVNGAIDKGGATDWLDEIIRTPFNQTYSISLRGGSSRTSYTASLDYTKNKGLIKSSDMEVIYPRINVVHNMWDGKLRLEASLSGYQRKYGVGYSTGDGANAYECALMYNPTYPVRNDDGTWNEAGSSPLLHNPAGIVAERKGDNKTTNLRMYGKATLSPIEGLNISALASRENITYFGGYYETQQHYSTTLNNRGGYASRNTSNNQNDLFEATAQYTRTLLADHHIDLLAGYSWNRWNYQNAGMDNYNFAADDYTYNNIGAGKANSEGRAGLWSGQNESKLLGYFGRFNYNYAGRYFLSVSVRREGSSKFGADHKWGTFPAVSAAWNAKGESFLKDFSTLSTLKLRAGYGVTGTAPGSPYMSLTRLNLGGLAYTNGQWVNMLRPSGNPNPDLRWEKKKELNIGLDFGFFNDRLSGSIDYYVRKTDDLIWDYAVPVPPYLSTSITANAGSIKNSGLEVAINAVPIRTRDFTWQSDINFSTNRNRLVSLSNDKFITGSYFYAGWLAAPVQQSTHRCEEGKPLGNFWGYKSVGIDDNGHWLIEGADGKVKPIAEQQPEDKQVLGNGLPKCYLNFNNAFSYKQFDLSISMRGAFGFKILNTPEMYFAAPVALGNGNIMAKAFDNVYGKRPLAEDQELQYVSYYLENGSYWKIDNVTLGYTTSLSKLPFIKKLRLYVNVSNLATITGYKGIDPEVGINGLSPSVDSKQRYPSARTYTVGINLDF